MMKGLKDGMVEKNEGERVRMVGLLGVFVGKIKKRTTMIFFFGQKKSVLFWRQFHLG